MAVNLNEKNKQLRFITKNVDASITKFFALKLVQETRKPEEIVPAINFVVNFCS